MPPGDANSRPSFFGFLGLQQRKLLGNLEAFQAEMQLFERMDILYWQAANTEEFYDDRKTLMQLYMFTHYTYWVSTASFLRGNLQESHSTVRIGIEAALNAYRIIQGDGTAEEFEKGAATFKHSVNRIRKARELNPDLFPLAAPLVGMHELCSEYASHADTAALKHRLRTVDRDGKYYLGMAYIEDLSDDHLAVFMLTAFETFSMILRIFNDFLSDTVKLVDASWLEELRACHRHILQLRKQRIERTRPKRPDPPVEDG